MRVYVMCDWCKVAHHRDESILTMRGRKQVRLCLYCIEKFNAEAIEKRAIVAAKAAA